MKYPLCTKHDLIAQLRGGHHVVSSQRLYTLLKAADYNRYFHKFEADNRGGFTPESVEAVLRDWESRKEKRYGHV